MAQSKALGNVFKLHDIVNVKDPAFGAKGDGVADDTAALALFKTFLETGVPGYMPDGTYKTSLPLNFTVPVYLHCDKGARIKLTASAAYVMRFDGSAGGHMYGPDVRDLILDGGGFATDGLYLKNVVNGSFPNLRVTNVTAAGLHMAWAQLCDFLNYTCSGNLEAFTTVPVNGILADVASSSANTFINPTIEGMSGSGIKGLALINSVFINGTSEGNNIGIEFGETTPVGLVAQSNVVVGMDLEVNTTTDIMLRATASSNNFFGLMAGFQSPAVQILASDYNTFKGGSTGGFNIDANSRNNDIDHVQLIGAGRTVTDVGEYNTVRGVFNITDAATIPDRELRRRGYDVVGAATFAINAALTSYAVVAATAGTITIGIPTNPVDAMELDVTVRNISGVGLTVTWNSGVGGYKIAGWTNPATGFNRSARFRYDPNIGYWFAIAMSQVDVAN